MRISIVFSFAMSFVYLGIGIFLIFSEDVFSSQYMSQSLLGFIIGIYGLVRLYSAFKKKREKEEENDNEDE